MLLVIDKKETIVRYKADTLRLERKDEPTKTIPIRMLERVVVYGNPLIEAGVWRALSEAGVPAVLLDLRGKQQSAFLGAGLATSLNIRRHQHRIAADPVKQLSMARYFVQQKCLAYALPLQRLQRYAWLDQQMATEFAQQVDKTLLNLKNASDMNALVGFEGQLAQRWFGLWKTALPDNWKFAGRNRQPPKDPVNALLSLAYTLMLGEVRQGLLQHGFEPAQGFLHQDYPGRESLALDMQEVFRAVVDDFVLKLLHGDDFTKPESFYYRAEEGCRLGKSARSIFYGKWAYRMQECPKPFQIDGDWQRANVRTVIYAEVVKMRQALDHIAASGGNQ